MLLSISTVPSALKCYNNGLLEEIHHLVFIECDIHWVQENYRFLSLVRFFMPASKAT